MVKAVKKALKGKETLSKDAKEHLEREIQAEIEETKAKLEELKNTPGRISRPIAISSGTAYGKQDRWQVFISSWSQITKHFSQPVDPLGCPASGIWSKAYEALSFRPEGREAPFTEDEIRRYGLARLLPH